MLFPGHAKSLGIRRDSDSSSSTLLEPKNILRRPSLNGDSRTSETAKKPSQIEGQIEATVVDDKGTPATKTLFVCNIPMSTTGVMLREAFSSFGAIESTNPTGGFFSQYGFGYINFRSLDSAIRARKQLNGTKLFGNSGVGVTIRFDRNRDSLDLRRAPSDQLAPKPTPPKDKINEWFRPRSRDRTEPEIRRRISAEQLNELLPKRASLQDRDEWPNGPPPTGPKPRPANISPPPLRRDDIYRPAQENPRIDSYRPSLESMRQERRPSDHEDVRHQKQADWKSWHEDGERDLEPVHLRHRHSNGIQRDHAETKRPLFKNSLQWTRDGPRQENTRTDNPRVPSSAQNAVYKLPDSSISNTAAVLSRHFSRGALEVEQDSILKFTSTELENIRPTPKSTANSLSVAADSDGDDYSPKCIVSSPIGVLDRSLEVERSSPIIRVVEVAELPPHENASDLATRIAAGISAGTLSPNPSYLRLHRALNDDTCSLTSDVTMSDKTAVSTVPSLRRKKCWACPEPITFLRPVTKCSKCSRHLHESCWKEQKDIKVCGYCLEQEMLAARKMRVASTTRGARFPQQHGTKTSSSHLLVHSESVNDAIVPQSITNPTFFTETAPPGAPKEHRDQPLTSLAVGTRSFSGDLTSTPSKPKMESYSTSPVLPASFDNKQPHVSHKDLASPPIGMRSDKDYTCYWWKSKKGCRFAASVCRYAHFDTGVMEPPTNGRGTILTCHFWKNGRCQKPDDECRFAHYDTGSYAPEPGQWPRHPPELSREASDPAIRPSGADGYSATSPRLARATTISGRTTEAYNRFSDAYRMEKVISNGTALLSSPVRDDEPSDGLGSGRIHRADQKFVAVLQGLDVSGDESHHLASSSNQGPNVITDLFSQSKMDGSEIVTRTPAADSVLGSIEPPDGENVPANEPVEKPQPVRHTGKRSGIVLDPRRRNAGVASQNPPIATGSVQAEHPSPWLEDSAAGPLDLGSVTPGTGTDQLPKNLNKLKSCQICSKTIFGNSAVCKGCDTKSKESMTKTIPTQPVAPESLEINIDDSDGLFLDSGLSQSPLQNLSQGPPMQTSKPPELVKGLKRPASEDHMFIANKKQKWKPITTALTGQNQSNVERQPPMPCPTSPVISDGPLAMSPSITNTQQRQKPPSLAELTEVEQLRRELEQRDRRIQELESSKEVRHRPEQVKNEKTPSPTEAKIAEAVADVPAPTATEFSETSNTDCQVLQSSSPRQSMEVTEPRTQANSKASPYIPTPEKRNPLSDLPIPLRKQASSREEVMNMHSRLPGSRGACASCSRRRARCLHDAKGNLDPEKARKFLQDYTNRDDGKRTGPELVKIKAAAEKSRVLQYSASDVEEDGSLANYGETSEDELMKDPPPIIKTPGKAAAKSPAELESMWPGKGSFEKVQKKTGTFAKSTKASAWTKKDERNAIARLKEQGVIFESDSDANSDEDGQDNSVAPPTPVYRDRPRDPLWQPVKKSRDLFEVAPEYLASDTEDLPFGFVYPQRKPRKQEWRSLLQKQCATRKFQFGNAHWEVDRSSGTGEFPRMVKTVEERQIVPFKTGPVVARSENPYDVHMAPARQVVMSFDKFLGMPERAVPCLVGQGDEWGRKLKERARGRVLGFRDGGKERERGVLGYGRRLRVPDDEKWPVGAKG